MLLRAATRTHLGAHLGDNLSKTTACVQKTCSRSVPVRNTFSRTAACGWWLWGMYAVVSILDSGCYLPI